MPPERIELSTPGYPITCMQLSLQYNLNLLPNYETSALPLS